MRVTTSAPASSLALISAALLLSASGVGACPAQRQAAGEFITADASGKMVIAADEPAADSTDEGSDSSDGGNASSEVEGEGSGPATDDSAGTAAPSDGADMPPAEGEK